MMKTVLRVAEVLLLVVLTSGALGDDVTDQEFVTDPEIIRQWQEMHPHLSRTTQLIKRYEDCVVRLYDLAVRNGTAPSRRLRSAVEEECAIRHAEGAKYAKERTTTK